MEPRCRVLKILERLDEMFSSCVVVALQAPGVAAGNEEVRYRRLDVPTESLLAPPWILDDEPIFWIATLYGLVAAHEVAGDRVFS